MILLCQFLIIFYFTSHLIWFIIMVENHFDLIVPKHPGEIYSKSNVNWFGAIFLYILYFCAVPICAVIAFMVWLCTVGRK